MLAQSWARQQEFKPQQHTPKSSVDANAQESSAHIL